MDLYETISQHLKQQKISKREFARRLIEREIRSKRTGDVLSEKIVYSYLDGTTTIRAELIPHIVDILGITEQELFDDSEPKRIKQLRHILANSSQRELETAAVYLKSGTKNDVELEMNNHIRKIAELLPYAPMKTVDKMIETLQKYKKLFEEFEREEKL